MFLNTEREGWLPKGRRNSIVLKPTVQRIDDSEDLELVRGEMQVRWKEECFKALRATHFHRLAGCCRHQGLQVHRLIGGGGGIFTEIP